MLNLKSLWMYCPNTSKLEHMNVNKGSKNFAWSSSIKINMSKRLVNHTFAYQSILTARWMSQNCCSDGMWYSCLMNGNNASWRLDRSEWSSKGLEKKRSSLLICVCVLLKCVESWLSHSFLLFFSLFFLIYLSPYYFVFSLCFSYISLLIIIFSLFLSKLGLTPSWNKDTPLDV